METKPINEIEEMEDFSQIMKAFHGMEFIHGMKTRLREYLEDVEGSSKRKVREVIINSHNKAFSASQPCKRRLGNKMQYKSS